LLLSQSLFLHLGLLLSQLLLDGLCSLLDQPSLFNFLPLDQVLLVSF
jgi:hypothetical protein